MVHVIHYGASKIFRASPAIVIVRQRSTLLLQRRNRSKENEDEPTPRRGVMRGDAKWTANNSMIAGAGGGLVASVATCPLDVVKTKLQAQRAPHGDTAYRGVVSMVKYILQTDGVRGLYRGLGPTILGYLPTWAIYFTVYDGIKTRFGEAPLGATPRKVKAYGEATERGVGNSNRRIYPAAQVKGYQPVMREHPWSLHILSAMCAGAISTMCTNPLWVIKTRFMTQPPHECRYRNTFDAFLTIYRTEGISAFYRGLFPSLLGITHVAVQFPLYESLKLWAQGDSIQPLSSSQILLCSGIAKMCASIATYPHEVVRTRMQTQRRLLAAAVTDPQFSGNVHMVLNGHIERRQQYPRASVIQTTKRIIKIEGWRGLYKGLSVNLLRTVPNSAVTMLTYELLMRHLSAHRAR